MRSPSIVFAVLLVTACTTPTPPATEANAVETNGADTLAEPENAEEAANVAPYTIGPHGERWMYGGNPNNEPLATYGVPNEQTVDVLLKCDPRGLFFSLDVDPATARGGAVITSGEARFQMPPTPQYSLTDFVVPYAEPLLSAMPATGLTVTYKNGQKSAFPGGPVVARIIAECRKRNAAGG